jgi:hypothetical protein
MKLAACLHCHADIAPDIGFFSIHLIKKWLAVLRSLKISPLDDYRLYFIRAETP